MYIITNKRETISNQSNLKENNLMDKLHFVSTLNAVGQIKVHAELCTRTGWTYGTRLTTLISEAEATITLLPDKTGEIEINPLGRISLTKGSRHFLEWGENDQLEFCLEGDKVFLCKYAE